MLPSCRQALQTGKDSFLMGPSGYGYLLPSIINPSNPLLEDFVLRTTAAADVLSASAYVHWDAPTSPYSNLTGDLHRTLAWQCLHSLVKGQQA